LNDRLPDQAAPETQNELRWPDWAGWPYLLLGLGILAIALSAWRPTPVGVWHDDGVYMMVGKALAQGDGLHYTGVVGMPPAPKFPPVYSGLLGLLWVVFGGVGTVTLIAEVLNLFFVAAAGAFMAYGLHVHGRLPRNASLAAALVAFSSGDLLRFALIPLSEPLFLALLMGALATWHVARNGAGKAPWLFAGLLVLMALTRTAGVAAVAGIGVALLVRAGVRRTVMIMAPVVVSMGLWAAWAGRQAAQIPESLSDVLGPYVGWLLAQMLGAPLSFLSRLPDHGVAVASRVSVLLLPGYSGTTMWLASVPLAVLAVLGWRRLHRHFPPFTWTALAYLLLLLVWPYVDRRLVAPLHPFVVALIVAGGVELISRWDGRRAGQVVAAVVLLWMGSYAVMTTGRIARGWPVSAYRIRADALATALEALEQTAGEGRDEGVVVGAPELWAALSLHGGWTVVPSARFAPAAPLDERPIWGTPEEQRALWRFSGVTHLVLERGGMIHGDALNLQEQECPGSVNILARMPPQMLVHVNWAGCSEGP
jgi:hypothetical protein